MHRIKLIIAALFLISPMAANADFVAYKFAGTSNSGWTLVGGVVLDESDAIAGDNLVDNFLGWGFGWTNGIDTFIVTSLDSVFIGGDFFYIDAAGMVSDVLLCTNSCRAFDTSHIVGIDSWDATTGPGGISAGDCCVGLSPGSWSGPIAIPVAEPGTLALLGLGLAGMGMARRRKR